MHSVFNFREGKFGFFDHTGSKMNASKELENELTIRAGKIVYFLNEISDPMAIGRSVKSLILNLNGVC